MSQISEDGSTVTCDCGRSWSAPWGETCPECGAALAQPVAETTEEQPKSKTTVSDAVNAVADRLKKKK